MNTKDQQHFAKISREARQRYFADAKRYHDPLASFRVGPRDKTAEQLRHHDDLVFFLGDRIYEILQQFVGLPVDPKGMTHAIQQTLLSIERIQGIRLQTHIFIVMDERKRSVEVKFGERCDLETFYRDLRHVKIVEVELPYERRKSILELPNGLPPIGGVPWRS